MNILEDLSEHLLNQSFENTEDEDRTLRCCQNIAKTYTYIEHSIAVLSDLRNNQSYIYKGAIAETFGFSDLPEETIQSIWEEEIFRRIHPDDLFERHLLELHFFHLLKSLPKNERANYHTVSHIRMITKKGDYVTMRHRTLYLCNATNGKMWLNLCLYNFATEKHSANSINGLIVNAATGELIKPNLTNAITILSEREREVLQLIGNGKISKEIADLLSISIHTVNRHRQNILEKLDVNSSIEAIKMGQNLNLIE